MWRHSVLLVLLASMSAACRSVSQNSAATSNVLSAGAETAPSTVFDFRVPGDDLPPAGRSLFDELFQDRTASVPRPVKVPFPFTELTAKIRAEGYEIVSAFLPRGRSLQRNAAKPAYFKFPRIVITPILTAAAGTKARVSNLTNSLFIGYVEPANQLEVISFNEAAGRFEFQIVKDYAPGKVPQVFYAKRSLCLACHQGQAPIFPVVPWRETNENPVVQKLISDARGSTTYLGQPIGDDTGNLLADELHSGDDLNNVGARVAVFDERVRRASARLDVQTLWNEGCRRADAESWKCRTDILGRRTPLTPAIREKVVANMTSYYPAEVIKNGLPLRPGSDFATFSPTVLPTEVNAGNIAKVRKAIETLKDTDSISPLIQRVLSSSEGDTNFDGWPDAFETGLADGFFFGKGNETPAQVGQAFDKLAAEESGKPDGLFGWRFRRGDLVRALSSNLGVVAEEGCCNGRDVTSIEPPRVEPKPTGNAPSDPQLHVFYEFCSRCHAADAEPAFMGGSDAQILAKLKEGAAPHLARLDWEAATSGIMPPKSSPEYKKLALLENENLRAEMLVFLTKLKQEAAAQ